MNSESVNQALGKVHLYCQKNNFKGYSLYDSHNGLIPFEKFGKWPSFLANQVIKRSPINFRPFLGIKKGINPKGYGLFLHIYSIMNKYDIIDKVVSESLSHDFYSWLVNNPSKGYNGHCWGYNYLWPKKDGSDVPAYTPSIVVTGFVARALLAYYQQFGNSDVGVTLESCAKFVLNDVHLFKGKEGYCFSYTPVKKDMTINANLLAAEVLAYSDYVNKTNKYEEYINEVIKFTLHYQNDDGSWFYSHDYETRKPKVQIDFHQGYVIESLSRIHEYGNRKTPEEVFSAISSGLAFYKKNQFDDEGWAYWRLPSKWPVDIHNQSQGIITFSKFKDYSPDYLPFASTIADWTIKNMQGKNGNVYYQKWPLITNKVNYMRWNQAWMLLALTTLMDESK